MFCIQIAKLGHRRHSSVTCYLWSSAVMQSWGLDSIFICPVITTDQISHGHELNGKKYLLSTDKYAPGVKGGCSEEIFPLNSMTSRHDWSGNALNAQKQGKSTNRYISSNRAYLYGCGLTSWLIFNLTWNYLLASCLQMRSELPTPFMTCSHHLSFTITRKETWTTGGSHDLMFSSL